MAESLRLRVMTPEKTVLDTEVDSVLAMGEDGSFGILPKHQPLMSKLTFGLLSFSKPGLKKNLAVMGGVLTTDGTTITILSPAAELSDDIDLLRAEEAKKRAEARLAAQTETTNQLKSEMALKRAITRIQAKTGRNFW